MRLNPRVWVLCWLLAACARSGLSLPEGTDEEQRRARGTPRVSEPVVPPVRETTPPRGGPPQAGLPAPPQGGTSPPIPQAGTAGTAGTPDVPDDPVTRADRIDLLFVIDDSGSMADKQALLSRALADLARRLIHPRCIDPFGEPLPRQPLTSTLPCPDGSRREFNAVQDMHIGVLTTSVASSGACMGSFGTARHAHLSHPDGVDTYEGQGFLSWDPTRVKDPPGQHDEEKLIADLTRMARVGTSGCADEASLEAFYRFLIDPEPHAGIEPIAGCADDAGPFGCIRPVGIDYALLEQRARFLRPDSLLAVIVVSDENDCSIAPRADALRFLLDGAPLSRATSICATRPAHPCCHPCNAEPPPNCPAVADDPECQREPYSAADDPLYLRCFDQKRRFGVDRSYSVERYVRGLTERRVPNQAGVLVPNPIFSDPSGSGRDLRGPDLVYFAAIVGVPWQDLAVDPGDAETLRYRSSWDLEQAGLWPTLIGVPERAEPPSNPLMIESVHERSGVHPITGIPLAPSTARERWANPSNGHEANLSRELGRSGFSSLQYACIFELETPRDCAMTGRNCDCRTEPELTRRPTCQDAGGGYGTLQWAAGATPGVRQLQVARGLREHGIAGSICARNATDPSRTDFGYRPALEALLERLRAGLQ
jgi:hypothetical protein